MTLVIILLLQRLREKGKQERSEYFDLDRRIASTLKNSFVHSWSGVLKYQKSCRKFGCTLRAKHA